MGLFSKLLSRRTRRGSASKQQILSDRNYQRRCSFETMEPRRMLSATPIMLGSVYIEEDLGSDLHGDRFEVMFAGGAAGTELTRLVISGDQNTPGFSIGDVFFDTEPSGLGADHSAPFRVEQLITANPNVRVEAQVTDGESLLVLDFHGFQAGDKLVFSIDVDEVEYLDPTETDLEIINDGFDPITSGVEFQSSQMTASFAAPHYQDAEASAIFWNRYDDARIASGLDLPEDNIDGKRDRTTGAFVDLQQQFDPASISGYVYADDSNDGIRDSGEQGLSGVTLHIIPVDTLEPQQTVTVTTDSNGYYEALGLAPGSYRVVEQAQPAGYLDGLDTAGTVNGVVQGAAVNPGDKIEDIFLGGGTHGIEYNFGEILPASLVGNVHISDSDGNCYGSDIVCEPLAGVTLHLLDANGQVIGQTVTDSQGNYQFTGLTPGIYSVIEFTPAGLIDAGAQAGTVGQQVRGEVLDANTITHISLMAGDHGIDYDFCEHLPSLISGYVYHDRNDNGLREAGEEAIGGVGVRLFDEDGNQVAIVQTDSDGYYEFAGLSAGSYRLVETQPSGWLDGQESVGRIDGRLSGSLADSDTISEAVLRWGSRGVEYNFGELLPGSLQGVVYADLDRDCVYDPVENPIAHVKIELLSAAGTLLATTYTDSSGQYSFDNLAPGTYGVRETQPDGYFQGGQKAGSNGGDDSVPDLITQIPIGSDQHLVHYDFCEVVPGSISGIVYVDPNQNEVHESAEQLLSGVTIQLLNANGQIVATTQTNEEGYYEFLELRPDVYGVHELQPAEYFHGGQQAGSAGGDDSAADLITAVVIPAGQHLVDYNFSEIPPSSIQGSVYVSTSGSCSLAPENPIAGVRIDLIDDQGEVVGTTRTDAKGHYLFEGLRPGEYALRESQPAGYFQGGQCVGTGGGNDQVTDLLDQIHIGAGADLLRYDFYEIPPATLAGYVFQDGPIIVTPDGSVPENLADIRDGSRTPDDTPIAGVTIELRHGITGLPITSDQALDGYYADGPIVAHTDQNGYYEFDGLPPGVYAVYQIQPSAYIDGIDTAGTTSGLPFNLHFHPSGTFDPFVGDVIVTLAKDPADDAIGAHPVDGR